MASQLKFPSPKGFVAPGFEEVLHVFRKNYDCGLEKGSGFAAYYKGKQVVNIWGGLADVQVGRPWTEDTISFFFSCTKFVSAVTIAHLIERGALSYQQKIASIWPEFAQNGKQDITVEMLLSNRAGLIALEGDFLLRWMKDDPKKLEDALARQKPYWPPGTAHGYHPITIGLYLDQIVQRTDEKKRSLAQYFKEEIAIPFGIDFHIGLPKALFYRAARLEPSMMEEKVLADKVASFKGDSELHRKCCKKPKDWKSPRSLNDPDFSELPCGSAHGVGTAAGMAKFAGILANGGQQDGQRLLSAESISLLEEPMSYGIDRTTSRPNIYGRGTMLKPVVEGSQYWYMFGHRGNGGLFVAADPHYKVGWTYITNHIDLNIHTSGQGQHKWKPLMEALFRCVHRQEGVHQERTVLNSHQELMEKLGIK